MFKSFLPLCLLMATMVSIHSCSVNRAEIDDSLKAHFDKANVEGCFTLLSNSSGKVTVYNLGLDTTRFSPAGTFNMVTALAALETGVLEDDKKLLKWDGVVRLNEKGDTAREWNKDLDFANAFQQSATWYFQQVARELGKDTLQHWVDTLGYGNRKITLPIDSSWLNQGLLVSADEQLGLVKRLYFDQLPFQKRTQQMVRDAMMKEDNTLYKMAYLAAPGVDALKRPICWVVGWVEENKHPFFFCTLVKAENQSSLQSATAIQITHSILKQYGFFEGKK